MKSGEKQVHLKKTWETASFSIPFNSIPIYAIETRFPYGLGEWLKKCTFLDKGKTAFLMFKKFENPYFGYV